MRKLAQRTTDQNRLMWQRLTDWAQQDKRYTLDGQRLDAHDFKELLMAAFKKEVRLAPNLENNGVIHLSRSTSRLTKEQFTEFLEFIAAEGAKRGIIFRDTPPDPIGASQVRFMENGVPEPPRNESELRAALMASCVLEECARVAEREKINWSDTYDDRPARIAIEDIAAAIRALEDKP